MKNNFHKFIFPALLILASLVLIVPQLALAQASLGLETGAATGLGTRDLKDIIVTVVQIILGFLGIVAVGLLIYGGFVWMTAGGSPDKVDQGKRIVINVAIGLVVILISFGIVTYVANVLSGATGATSGSEVEPGDGNGPGNGLPSEIFRLQSIQPTGQLSYRNVVARLDFNRNLDPLSLDLPGAVEVARQNEAGGFDPVEGSLSLPPYSQATVLFTPDSPCLEPNGNLFCFDYSPDNPSLNIYRITVNSEAGSALRSLGGQTVDCGLGNCSAQFIVGANVELDANRDENIVISSVDPDNGAPGNWITISGTNFGARPGLIRVGDLYASLPEDDVCPAAWSDNRIIASLPDLPLGIQPLQVITSDNLSSNQFDFLGNRIVRPGICSVEPIEGYFEDTFNLTGIQFGAETDERSVVFGSAEEPFTGLEPVWSTQGGFDYVSAGVPNLTAGETSVRVRVGNQNSNGLKFDVQASDQSEVLISYFTPESGADSQYITIYGSGFGDYAPGVSQVKFATDKQGSFSFPDQCGTNFWTNTQIVVKVPQREEVGLLDERGPLQVITAGGKVGLSQQNFAYDPDLAITPGVCSLYPQSVRAGETFSVAGEGFAASTLYLSDEALASEPSNNNYFENVLIPLSSRSGPVKVARGDEESNSLNLEVLGATAPDQPIVQAGHYQWQFTTCQDCLTPEVVESGSCWDSLASPSPVKNSQANYSNTLISATFNTDMDDSLFELGSTVLVAACGQGDSPVDCREENRTGSFSFGSAGANFEYFTLTLDNPLEVNTWYQVTLSGLTSSLEQLAMAEDYVWSFKTRLEDISCEPDRVTVNPASRLVNDFDPANNRPVFLGEQVVYRSSVFNSETCNVCPDAFEWSWGSSQPEQARIDTASISSRSLLVAEALTDAGTPALISARAVNAPGSPQGAAVVDIVPANPRIVYRQACTPEPQSPSPWPGHREACVNSRIAVEFDRVMDPVTTLASENFLAVYLIGEGENMEEIPIAGTIEGLSGQRDGQNGLTGLVFTPDDYLPSDRWVKVTLSRNISSLANRTLAGDNTWSFKTASTGEPCDFTSALVDPSSALLNSEGGRQNYTALAQGPTCELITSPDLVWSWLSENSSIASITDIQGDNNEQAAAIAANQGITHIRASALGLQNTGENGRLSVNYGTDEALFGIIDNQPRGENVCLNAQALITFNLSLSGETFSSAKDNFELWQSNQRLSYCSEQTDLNCTSDEYCREQNAGDCTANWTVDSLLNRQAVRVMPSGSRWQADTPYTIRIYGGETGVTAASGEQLVSQSCPEGMAWNEVGGYCWWSFTTSEEDCVVDQVVVEPAEASAYVGQKNSWLGIPYAANGNPLNEPISRWYAENVYSLNNLQVAMAEASTAEGFEAESEALSAGQAAVFAGALKEEGAEEMVWGNARLAVSEVVHGPSVTRTLPQSGRTDVCRNAQVVLEFDQPMDSESVNLDNLKVGSISQTQDEGCYNVASQLSYRAQATKTLAGRLFNWLSAKLLARLVNSAQALNIVWFCPIDGQWLLDNHFDRSEAKYVLSEALPPSSDIKVMAMGGANGIKGQNNMPLEGSNLNGKGNFVFDFSTGSDICALSEVSVTANQSTGAADWIFTTSFDNQTDNNPDNLATFDTINDRDKKYVASGFSSDGTRLSAIEGVYEWDWNWRAADSAVAAIVYSGQDLSVTAAQNVKKGETQITAEAIFPDWYEADNVSGSGLALVDLCANPWPARISEQPSQYVNSLFNFGLSYCRDAGGENVDDDLPALNPNNFVINDDFTNRRDDVETEELLYEYLIPVPTTEDLIGLRVYENSLHLTPQEWYRRNVGVQGSPVSLTIDGYPAIQDGRTVYVSAADVEPIISAQVGRAEGWSFARLAKLIWEFIRRPLAAVRAADANLPGGTIANVNFNPPAANVNINPPAVTPFIPGPGGYSGFVVYNPGVSRVTGISGGYHNIFLLSYNQGASPVTQDIVSQLIARWQFNTNVNNMEVKEKIIRDTARLAQLNSLAEALDRYETVNGKYPQLEAGSFLAGRSTSKWPSWSQTFGSELGIGAPSDPLNTFSYCLACQEASLVNAGFEDEALGWQVSADNAIAQINTDIRYVKQGAKSLALAATQGSRGISQPLSLLPNVSYEMSAWVYVASGRVQLTFIGDDYGNQWISPADFTGWIQLKNRLTTNNGQTKENNPTNNLFIQSYGGEAVFYADDVVLETSGGNCGYDPETCWNPLANRGQGAFYCGKDSYFYSYDVNAPAGQVVSARLETTTNWGPLYGRNYLLNLSTANVAVCTE